MSVAAILAFARSPLGKGLGLGLLILAIVAGIYWKGQADKAADVKRAAAVAEAKAELVDAKAKEAAAGERVTDRVKVETAREEQINATQNLPDGAPSPRQRSRVDVILRQQQGAGDAAR